MPNDGTGYADWWDACACGRRAELCLLAEWVCCDCADHIEAVRIEAETHALLDNMRRADDAWVEAMSEAIATVSAIGALQEEQ